VSTLNNPIGICEFRYSSRVGL